jgi:hypothetical protein
MRRSRTAIPTTARHSGASRTGSCFNSFLLRFSLSSYFPFGGGFL